MWPLSAGPKPSQRQLAIHLSGLAIMYALGSFAAFALFEASAAGAVFFPPAGLTVAALSLSDRRRWPSMLLTIAVTETLVDLSQGQQMRYVWGFAAANVVEPLLGAWLLTRRWPPDAQHRCDVGPFPLWAFVGRAVVAAPLVGGAIGTATVVWGQGKGSWSSVYGPYFAGDALAVLTIGSTLLIWSAHRRARRPVDVVHTSALLVAVGATAAVGYWPANVPLFYLPLPLVAFIGVRYRSMAMAGLCSVVVAVTANVMSVLGHGPWAHVATRAHYGMTTLQGFLAVSTLTAMVLAREADRRASAEREATTERAQRTTLQVLFDHSPCGVVAARLDGTISRVNDTFTELLGRDPASIIDRVRFSDLLTVGGRLYYETHFWPLLRLHGKAESIAFDLMTATGERRPVLVNAELSVDDGRADQILLAVFDARERRVYEQELLAARQQAEDVAHRLEALQQLTARLSTATTTDDVANAVITEGVRLLATHAVLGVIDRNEPGILRTWPTFGRTDPLVASFRQLPTTAPLPVTEVVRSGRPLELLSAHSIESRFPMCAGTLAHTGAKSMLGIPIHLGDECVGALMLGFTTEGPIDLTATQNAEGLSTLIGSALERAWRYEHEYDNAHQLQRALLPTIDLPDAGIDVSAFYRPAHDQNDVGGDWYDVFTVGDNHLAIVVGDVVGHDLPAAASMGRLQSAVRLLALANPHPSRVLELLDRAVDAIPGAIYSTMFYGLLDLRTGRLTHTSAGHPPPLLVSGQVDILTHGRGAPLGITDPREIDVITIPLGAHLVLYTDGLIENRGTPIDESLRTLSIAAARLSTDSPARWCTEILDRRSGPQQFDDIVLMCVTRARKQ